MKLLPSSPFRGRAGQALFCILLACGCWGIPARNAGAQDCVNIASVIDLGTNVAALTRAGQVSAAGDWLVYRLTIATSVRSLSASVNSTLLGLTLFRDDNNNATIDQADTAVSSCGPQTIGCPSGPSVSEWLNPGTYYLGVCPVRGGAAFQLSVSTTARLDSPGAGDDSPHPGVRQIAAGQPVNEYVGVFDPADYYKVQVDDPVAEVTAIMPRNLIVGGGDLTLKLFPTADEQINVSSMVGSFGDPTVSLWLDRGTYYLKVDNLQASFLLDGATFRLNLTQVPKAFSPGHGDNDWRTARLLLPRSPTNDFVGISDTLDYYKVVVSQAATIQATIPYTTLSTDVELTLLQESPGGGLETLAQDLGTPVAGPRKDAVVSAMVAPGTYYLRVEPADPTDNRNNTKYLISLSAPEPPLPCIELSGDLVFGDVAVNSTATRTLTINNCGPTLLNVSGITYPSPRFTGNFSGTLAAGASTNVTVNFAPTAGIIDSGLLTVNSDAVLGLNTRLALGRGATRVINLNGPIDFGGVETLQQTNRILNIQNTGNAPLNISSIDFPVGFTGAFTGSISAAATVPVTVTFAPGIAGEYSGNIVVNSDKTSGTHTTMVSGTGTPTLNRTMELIGDLDFGLVEAGRSTNRILIVTNAGEAAITVSGIDYPGAFSGNYNGGVIPPRGFRRIVVTFSPPAPGDYGGLITVNSPNFNGGTNSIQASGTGTRELSRIIGLIGDLEFGSIPARSSSVRKLTITNTGEAPLTISNITYPTGFSGTFTGLVAAGGSRMVMVTFNPRQPITYGGAVTVVSDANGGQNTLQASGSATPVPLRPVPGAYAGLFRQFEDGVHHESSGYFTFNAAPAGSYSATILLAGRKHVVSGRFAFDGIATNTIRRLGKETLTVVWNADPNGDDQITGTIEAGWVALMTGYRAVYAVKTNNAPQAGLYTLLVPGTPPPNTSPEGDGFGTVKVTPRGVVRINGTLADGAKFVRETSLSREGHWPFYSPLYAGRGSLFGWLRFAEFPAEDLGGVLNWNRPRGITANKLYPDGFEAPSDAIGSRYTPPLAGNRAIAISNGVVAFSGGNLPQSLTNFVTLGLNNRVTHLGPHKLTMNIVPANGLFNGALTPIGDKKPVQFHGILLQRTNSVPFGAGYFLGTNESGRVLLHSATP